jgi:hypothetical protein
MISKTVVIGLAAALLAGCAHLPKQAPSPPPPPLESQASPPPAEPLEPRLAPVDVRRMTCATLNSAADDDKAYASTFLLGYRSALTHSHTIEVKRIEAVEEAALADCATKPEAMASKVFAAALAKIAAGNEPERPRRRHRKHAPGEATPADVTPAQATPAQATPEEASPSQSPSMQYAPAQTPSPQPAPAEPPPPESRPSEKPPQ